MDKRIEKKTVYTTLFILIAICQLYVESFRVNIFFQLGVLGFCFFLEPVRFSSKMYQHLSSLVLIMLIGFAGTAIHLYSAVNIYKDVFHFIKPIAGLLLGYTLFKRIGDLKMVARAIVLASVITAIIHLCIILFLTNFMSGKIEVIRFFTKDNFLELFGLFLLAYFPKYEGSEVFKNIWYKRIFISIMLLSSLLYFSRTMFVIAGIMWLTMKGYTKVTAKGLKVIAIVLTMTGLLYSYLFSANIKRDGKGFEGFLYKIKNAPEEIFTFNIDREDHADLWDHWRGYEAKRALDLMHQNPSSYIFGTGHGSLVDLKFYAPITGEKKGIRFISDLHNGYIYIFYKTGVIGLAIYLFLLLRWYAYIYKRDNLMNILISAGGLIFLMTTVMISGLYNNKDIIIFIIGGALYLSHKSNVDRLQGSAIYE